MNAEDIKKLVEQKAAFDPRLRSIVRRMESGTATFKETSEYSRIFSEIVGDTLSEHVLSLEDREAVANELLRYGYENINSILAKVQADIDKKNRVNIRPQKASFPQERAEQFSHSLTDPTVPDETIERRANNGTANITMSFHDDYMRENAEFRSNAGLRCYIDRQTNGKCCTWCSDIAGRYDYGNEPQDVYRRHDNCDCTVTYENGRQRQDVWSKRSWEVPKNGLKYTKPTVISRSEARRLNEEKRNAIFINNPSIDNGGRSDIIEEREYGVPYGEYSLNADIDYINSDSYSSIFNNISDNQAVNDTLLECARTSIEHRNGTKFEDMYFIHAETGEILAKQVDMTYPSGISYNDEIKSLLKRAKEENIPLVTIHNHPEGYPPSVDDINKSFENNTVFGIAVGHNGQVYKYNNPGKKTEGADIIHFNIMLLCRDGSDPDRIYTDEYKLVGLEYKIIKGG